MTPARIAALTTLALAPLAAAALTAQPAHAMAATAALGWTLAALAWIDIERLTLPDALTLPLIAAGLALRSPDGAQPMIDGLIGAALGYGLPASFGAAYFRLRGRDGLGLGDAKLLAAAGAWLGWAALPVVLFLAASGALVFALLVAARRGHDPARPTPFGPFLALAFWFGWLSGA